MGIYLFAITGPKVFFAIFFAFLYWVASMADSRSAAVPVENGRKKKGETPEVFEGDKELYADFIHWKWIIQGEEYTPGEPVERYGAFAEFLQYRLDRSTRIEEIEKTNKEAEKANEANSAGSGIDGGVGSGNTFKITPGNVMRLHDVGFDPLDETPEIDNPIHAAFADDTSSGEWTMISDWKEQKKETQT